MALADFLSGGAEAPEAIDPRKLARQTVGVQEEFLGGRQRLRSEFDPQIIQGASEQLGRSQTGLRGVQGGITQDIISERQALGQASADQLRQQSQGFAGAERLQGLLQQQAEDQLQRGGALSGQQMRSIDQLTQGATARQGRGSGQFNIGQLALGRAGAIQANEDRARQFAQQTQQGGLAVSNPLQQILAREAGTAGTSFDRLRNIQGFGQQNTVDFDPINAQVAQNARQQQQAEQAQFTADRNFLPDLISGGLSLAGSVGTGGLSSMFGGFGGGGGQNPIPQFGRQA